MVRQIKDRAEQKLRKRLRQEMTAPCCLLASALAVTGLPLGTMKVQAESPDGDDTRVNFALDGVATAEKAPIEYWGPDKLIDGIINRDASKPDQSR